MAEATQFLFSYQEVVEALIKQQGIHNGLWRLVVEFGFSATNVNTSEGLSRPAAINLLQQIGITQVEETNNLTVDAAKVNPLPKAAKKSTSKKKSG